MQDFERSRTIEWLRRLRGDRNQLEMAADITERTGWSIDRSRYSKYESGSLPFAAMFGAHALAVVASGWGPAWIGRLLASSSEIASPFNYAPSRIIGVAWIPIGIALGAIAFWRGKPALAGLLVSPYWLPYYFLLPLAELAPRAPELAPVSTPPAP